MRTSGRHPPIFLFLLQTSLSLLILTPSLVKNGQKTLFEFCLKSCGRRWGGRR